MNKLTNSAMAIFETTEDVARRYGHVQVRTTHLLLNILSYLKRNDEDGLGDALRGLLDKFEIEGKELLETFKDLYTVHSPIDISIDLDGDTTDFIRLFNVVSAKGQKDEVSQNIASILLHLLTDRTYKVFNLITPILDSNVDGLAKGLNTDKFVKEAEVVLYPFVPKPVFESELDEIPMLINLNKYVEEKDPTIIGLQSEISQLEVAMSVKTFKNVVLVGPAGTGKTTVVWELVKRINSGKVADSLKGKRVYELDLASLVAGTKFRGEFEERLTSIIAVLQEEKDAILFIDELHMISSVGDNDGGATTGNILKRYLSTGDITVIGATTNAEYAKHIEKDKAIARRFHKILVNEPNSEELRQILEGVVKSNEEYHTLEMEDGLIEKVVDFSERYEVGLANPARSINMLELGFAHAKVNALDNKVRSSDVVESISKRYSLNVVENRAAVTEAQLYDVLKGQDTVIEEIVNNLKYVDEGLVDPQKPLASFLFAGPTGVGKTEAAKIIAESFFGTPENLIKLNMGEYSEPTSVAKIVGSAPGYVGYDSETGLVAQVKQRPASVILLDEFEKAHPEVQKVFLNILDEGSMLDNKGESITFKSTIIIFTSNIGYTSTSHKKTGLAFNAKTTSTEDVLESIKKTLRPEFINRIDSLFVFNRLTNEIARELIDRYVEEFSKAIKQEIKFTEEDYKEVMERENIEEYGARGLKRSVRTQVRIVKNRKNDKEEVSA